MKSILLTTLLLYSTDILAQNSGVLPYQTILKLDTVAVTGHVSKLTLAPPGSKTISLGALSPNQRLAVKYLAPTDDHEYDIRFITIHFNTRFKHSSTGLMQVQLALVDSITGEPSNFYLLKNPIIVSPENIKKSHNNTISTLIQGKYLSLNKRGIFVVLSGVANTEEEFIKDTLISKGNSGNHYSYIELRNRKSGRTKLVNSLDFISVDAIRTLQQPVSWNYVVEKSRWHRFAAPTDKCDTCEAFNYWIELGVEEL